MKLGTLFLILAFIVAGAYFAPVSEIKSWCFGTSKTHSKAGKKRVSKKKKALRIAKTKREKILKRLKSQLASKKRRLAKYDSKPWKQKTTRKRRRGGV